MASSDLIEISDDETTRPRRPKPTIYPDAIELPDTPTSPTPSSVNTEEDGKSKCNMLYNKLYMRFYERWLTSDDAKELYPSFFQYAASEHTYGCRFNHNKKLAYPPNEKKPLRYPGCLACASIASRGLHEIDVPTIGHVHSMCVGLHGSMLMQTILEPCNDCGTDSQEEPRTIVFFPDVKNNTITIRLCDNCLFRCLPDYPEELTSPLSHLLTTLKDD